MPIHDIESEIRSRKLHLISLNAKVGLIATSTASLILVAASSHSPHFPLWLLWWLVLLVVSIVRTGISKRYLREEAAHSADPAIWSKRYTVLISVLSLMWTGATIAFSWQAPPVDHLLAALVVAAMAAGSISTLAPMIALFRIYASPMIIAVAAVSFFSAEQDFDFLFSTVALIYLYGVSRSASYLHSTLSESIRLAITERKQAEELRFANMVYRALGEAVVITDDENRIVATNTAFGNMIGIEKEQAIGMKLSDLESGRTSHIMQQHIHHAIATQGHWQGEVCYRNQAGEEIIKWLSLTATPDTPPRYVGIISNVTDQKHAEEIAWREANFDALTSLPNRRLFRDRLTQEIKKVGRSDNGVALLLIDLDHFNEINDTLGHDTGDLLLIEAARRIQSCIRASDTIARTGGDEFSIALSEFPDAGHIERIAQTISEQLREPFDILEESIYISASIGIAFHPQDSVDTDDLIKKADQAMFASKREGGNRYGFFTNDMLESMIVRRKMINDLRNALKLRQFVLYYQPIVSMHDGAIDKAEALLRWEHPELGTISPAEFIPLAEESGLINAIGDWAFREVASQVKRWQVEDDIWIQVSVNKSPAQFSSAANSDGWLAYLKQIDLSGEHIVIEITESMILDANPRISIQLQSYRTAGMQISIDDFGTGYSSLSYLKKFEASFLKIDQSFVRDLENDPKDLALSEAIIVMSHKLGLKVIAEGIETERQRTILHQAGCDFGQGYLFSKPVPADAFRAHLRKQAER